MRRSALRPLASALLLALPVLAFAQGQLTPPDGAIGPRGPVPTMKTLDQVEPRIPLRDGAPGVTQNANGGFTISASGSYYLTGNLTVTGGNAITITTSNVTLDLNGFTLATTTASIEGTAIESRDAAQSNITIRNGTIASNITVDTNTSIIAGHGFEYGIFCGSSMSNCLVSQVNIRGIREIGVYLDGGSTIDHCVAEHCNYGMHAQVITHSSAMNCNAGINGNVLADCYAMSGVSTAISSSQTATNCDGFSKKGNGLRASTATNCQGFSQSSEGLSANIATNCLGYSTSDIGLLAGNATNCRGTSTSGTGLFADNATNCRGTSDSGTGLATNGQSNDDTGTATGCTGISNTGHGLIAAVATNCTGRTTDKSKIGVWVSGTATGCRGANTGDTGTGDQAAINCSIAIACTAANGTIIADARHLGTP
jgi:hypothetical protein